MIAKIVLVLFAILGMVVFFGGILYMVYRNEPDTRDWEDGEL